MRSLAVALLLLSPAALWAQDETVNRTLAIDSLSIKQKGVVHLRRVFGPKAAFKNAAVISFRQAANSPFEWGQGADGLAKRIGARYATSISYNSMMFILGSALREDPRYFRLGAGPIRARVGTAVWQVVTTRTDSGGRRVSVSRFGAAIGTAFLSNTWQPDRRSTTGAALRRTGINITFAVTNNILSEFWPDMKRMFSRGSSHHPAKATISSN